MSKKGNSDVNAKRTCAHSKDLISVPNNHGPPSGALPGYSAANHPPAADSTPDLECCEDSDIRSSSSFACQSLPVHCIVQQSTDPHAELESFAIVPCDTPFHDLVKTALVKLGYSTSQILGAEGCIKIKKWKPIAFHQITESPEATVADILGELGTVASLHVRLYSVPMNPCEWNEATVRKIVLKLLKAMSQKDLAKLCPLSQAMLSYIFNKRHKMKIDKEKCEQFGEWYLNYIKENPVPGMPT